MLGHGPTACAAAEPWAPAQFRMPPPLLFFGETARYYHRRFFATYSLAHADGGAHDDAAHDRGNRLGSLRRAACRVGGPRTDAAARQQAAGRTDIVQAAMRDLSYQQFVRSGSSGTVAVQVGRPDGRQGRRYPLFDGLRGSQLRLG